ncbi:Katanin p80 WD40 repeat-containing subunit B1-like, partial [Durusdinium trenchii]
AQEDKSKAAAREAEQEEAIQEAKQAKARAEADANSMEEHSDLNQNRYLKYGLLVATLVAWGSLIGLLWSRYKHQELHDHHLNMI